MSANHEMSDPLPPMIECVGGPLCGAFVVFRCNPQTGIMRVGVDVRTPTTPEVDFSGGEVTIHILQYRLELKPFFKDAPNKAVFVCQE